jgi:hypothetical protein
VEMNGQFLTFSAELDKGGIEVISDTWPPNGTWFGYIHLPDNGVDPWPCSSICDDSSSTVGLPVPFTFDGVTYDSLVMGSNGVVIPGSDDDNATDPANQHLPDPTTPNPLAPFWTDIDMDGSSDTDTGAGIWYLAVFGTSAGVVTIIEWVGVEEWGVPGPTYTFQIQIWHDGAATPGIWYSYRELQGVPSSLTVGAENAEGTAGSNYYFDGEGTFPLEGDPGELKVIELIGGTATVNFQMEADCSVEAIVNEATISTADQYERAVAVTRCE